MKALQPGARVNEAGRDGIPVESFGAERLGASIAAIERVCAEIGVSLSEVKLSDLSDYAFSYNLGFLEAMLLGYPRPIPVRIFVLGLKPSEEIQDAAWTPCLYKVPFVLKFKGRNLVLWLSGVGDAYVPDGLVQGFRLGPPDVVDVEPADFEVQGNGVAAAYFADGWAPVPIDAQREFTFDGTAGSVPVVGEYRWLGEDDGEASDAN